MPFSSLEPLGLMCSEPRDQKRRALGTRVKNACHAGQVFRGEAEETDRWSRQERRSSIQTTHHHATRLFTVPYVFVRSSRSSAYGYGWPSWFYMSREGGRGSLTVPRPLSGFDTHSRWPPVTPSLRSWFSAILRKNKGLQWRVYHVTDKETFMGLLLGNATCVLDPLWGKSG